MFKTFPLLVECPALWVSGSNNQMLILNDSLDITLFGTDVPNKVMFTAVAFDGVLVALEQ